jgi:hypothetical protein
MLKCILAMVFGFLVGILVGDRRNHLTGTPPHEHELCDDHPRADPPPGITLQTDGVKWSFLTEYGIRYNSIYETRADAVRGAWIWHEVKMEHDENKNRVWKNATN